MSSVSTPPPAERYFPLAPWITVHPPKVAINSASIASRRRRYSAVFWTTRYASILALFDSGNELLLAIAEALGTGERIFRCQSWSGRPLQLLRIVRLI